MPDAKKLFKCEICDYICSQKSHLNQHVALIHVLKKSFICEVYKYQFSQKSTRPRHVATVHEVKKPFKCDICNKLVSTGLWSCMYVVYVHTYIFVTLSFSLPVWPLPYQALDAKLV